MVSIDSKENLIKQLEAILFQTADSAFYHAVKSRLVHPDKFDNKQFMKFATDVGQLNTLPEPQLLWFAQAVEAVNPEVMNAAYFFTEHEQEAYKNYTCDKADLSQLYILHNAFRLAEHQWGCTASIEQIALMRKYHIIRTNGNFQRQSKMATGEQRKKIQSNPKRVKDIARHMVEGTYHFNTIRLNLMDDEVYQPDLNALQSERKIVLPQGGDYIIPDGNYRCDACEKAYFDYPQLREQFQHQFFQIAFTFYTAEQVKQLLSQEWNTEKVSPQSIEAMKSALVARTHLL